MTDDERRRRAHARKLSEARAYLKERGIAATAKDSKFRYVNAAGQEMQPPSWFKKDAPLVVVSDERKARQ